MNSDEQYLHDLWHGDKEVYKINRAQLNFLKENAANLAKLEPTINQMNEYVALADDMYTYGAGEDLIHRLRAYSKLVTDLEVEID